MSAPGTPQDLLRAFIRRYLPVTVLDDDQDLFETGVIDSLFLIQMLTFIESSFGIKVETGDLDHSHFRTLNRAGAFIARKRGV